MPRLVRLLLGMVLFASVASAGPASATVQSLPDRIDLPDGWAPEGITAGRGSIVYVGSLANGGIWRGDVRTGTGSVLVAGVAGRVAVGVEFDRRSDRIWVAGGATGAVRVHDATSGVLLETYQFTAGFLNDVVVTRDAVFVTDSMRQQLDVIPLGRGGALPAPSAAFVLPLTGEIEFVAGQFNTNGIVASGGSLLVVQSNKGLLFRVDPDTGVARQVDLGGASVTNGDGLELHGMVLYVVRNQLERVDLFRLHRSLRTARLLGTLTSPDFDIPTTAAFTAGNLWVVNARFGTPVTPTTPYWITRLPARP